MASYNKTHRAFSNHLSTVIREARLFVQSNLLCCLSAWTSDIDLGRPVDILRLDFSKAFDKVPKSRLLHKLQHLGIQGNLLGWIDSFVSDRTFRVKVGDGLSRSVDVVNEMPQGSVRGPLIFVAYSADIKNTITSPFAMFADHIKLDSSCANYRDLERDLRAIYDWTGCYL